jgi:membrane-associated phospholipid phosphatase
MAAGRRSRIARFAAGAVLFGGSLAVAKRGLPEPEERVFRSVNGADDRIRTPVWTVMQAGTFVTVPAAVVLALVARRRDLSVRLALGGTAAWLLGKAVKPLAGRPRPAGLLPDVNIRDRFGQDLGWVSGHSAVATTLALVAEPGLPTWSRPLLRLLIAAVGFGRMYVGAHLPLDVAGGTGLGLMLAAAAAGDGSDPSGR